MQFNLYSPVHFEKWCWRNAIETGIGGSESSSVEMSWRLARRGHKVINYVPLPADIPSGTEWRNVIWRDISEADFSEPGCWVLYRCPETVDKFDHTRTDQVLWLLLQDWWYRELTTSRSKYLHRIIPLCNAHRQYCYRQNPEFDNKMWVTRNGIKLDLVEETERLNIVRNPKRIMYASSPDRGLLPALKIFKRAKEFVPDLELHITYGFNNIDKLIDMGAKNFLGNKNACLKLIDEIGAVMHGRLSQNQLYQEWFKSSMTVYATLFAETGPCHGDTIVETAYGPEKLKDLVGKSDFGVYSCNANGELAISKARNVELKRIDEPVLKISCENGTELILTYDHEVMLSDGKYISAERLKPGDILKAFIKSPIVGIVNQKVSSVEPAGTADVYCMEVNPDHNFVANGIFVHNCITLLEAQAMGALPIFSPIWAQGENTKHGVAIPGHPDDPLTIARFAEAVVRIANNPEAADRLRPFMMDQVRKQWDWEVFVTDWINAASEDFQKAGVSC